MSIILAFFFVLLLLVLLVLSNCERMLNLGRMLVRLLGLGYGGYTYRELSQGIHGPGALRIDDPCLYPSLTTYRELSQGIHGPGA